MSPIARSAALAIALASACGGRSALKAPGARGDGGGGPSSTSAGGAGGEGAGGAAPGSCEVAVPVAELAGTGPYAQRRPTLVRSSADGETATLVAAWRIPEGPGDVPPAEIRHTSFSPWSAWPPDGALGPSYLADYDGGESFAPAPDPGGFALLFQNAASPPSDAPALVFLPGMAPGSGDLPPATLVQPGDARVQYAVRGAAAHLAGASVLVPVSYLTEVAVIVNGTEVPLLYALGCSTDPPLTAGAPAGDHFLVAFSAGHGIGLPGCPDPDPGPAEHVLLARVDLQTVEVVTELDASPGTIAALAAVPSPAGAWIVWSRATAGAPAPALLARVDDQGHPVFGPIEAPIPQGAAWLSATDLGDRLALGWLSPDPGGADRLGIAILDLQGHVVGAGSLPLDAPAEGPLSLLGAPSGASLLASWSEGPTPDIKARVARFDCDLLGRP